MSDLDVLVPADRALAAVDILKNSGFRAETLNPLGEQIRTRIPMEQDMHHYGVYGGPNESVRVEVHFSFALRLLSDSADLAWFWAQTMPASARDSTLLNFSTLTPEAHLLYLCAHMILQHGQETISLSRYYDLHLLASLETLDWQLIINQAVKLCWTFTVERALTLTQSFFGTPVPEEVLVALRDRRPATEDVTIVLRLAQGDIRWMQATQSFNSLTPSQRWFILLKIIAPPHSYMRTRYRISANRPVWPYYPYRWFDQFRGMVRGVHRGVQIKLSRARR